jgi:hypothetical protein
MSFGDLPLSPDITGVLHLSWLANVWLLLEVAPLLELKRSNNAKMPNLNDKRLRLSSALEPRC